MCHIVTPFVINFTRKIWKIRGGGYICREIIQTVNNSKNCNYEKTILPTYCNIYTLYNFIVRK